VTPPGGSRDDDADDAPGRGDAPDRPGDDRDPELRAMRAVWLAMRDEDPPDRGLGDLLAAARHQAEAMRPRPSAWQRLLAALRRPPVLAFATVTVLIAGAVLIGRRVPPEAAPVARSATVPSAGSPADPATADPATAVPATVDPAIEPGPAALPRTAPPMQPPAPTPPVATAPPARSRGGRAEPALRDAPPLSARPSGNVIGTNEDRAAGPLAPEPPPPAPALNQAASGGAPGLGAFSEVSGHSSAPKNNVRTAPAEPTRAAPLTDASGTAANRPGNDSANKAPSRNANRDTGPVASGVAPARPPAPATRSGAGDLYQQSETAARRGDCATVRRLVDQILQVDPGYRARLPGDSPVTRCLAP
jgi:hypothetical protein